MISWLILIVVSAGCAAVRGERVELFMSPQDRSDPGRETSLIAPRDSRESTYVDQVGGNGAFSFTTVELSSRDPLFGEDLVRDGQVVVTFVVPSCPICIAEGPELARSAAANPEVTYVVVHSGGTIDDYEHYVRTSGLGLDNVVHVDDSPGLLWLRFGIVQQPSNIFVDADGGVSQSLGALGESGLEVVVSEL